MEKSDLTRTTPLNRSHSTTSVPPPLENSLRSDSAGGRPFGLSGCRIAKAIVSTFDRTGAGSTFPSQTQISTSYSVFRQIEKGVP